MSENLYDLLDAQIRARADAPCIQRPDGDDWSYRVLGDQAARAAAALDSLGVAPGDRVLVQVPKSAEAVALYLGCLKVGAVYVPINTAYTRAEVDYFLGDAAPRVFVAGESVEFSGVAVETLDEDGRGSFFDLMQGATPRYEIIPRAAEDLAAIVYTSGTTGRSKGAMLSHGNLSSNALMLVDYWGFSQDDVLLHALPIFHVHGLFVALHCVFLSGSSMIWQPGFNADATIQQLPNATVLMGVPTFYTRLLGRDDFTAECCGNMRLFISGSAPLTEQTFDAFEQRTGQRILERYGMSETLMNTSNPLDGERVAGTVGFALPGVETRIAADDGTVLGAGEVGGIEIRGPNVFAGYWQMADKTAEEFRDDGFFKSGDLGQMDSAGRVTIVGREKDLVISGGYNVYPKEIEKLIDEMPEVTECAVIGVPHADFGEGVVAVVVPSAGEVNLAMVDAALDGKLARFKQPKRVVCVDSLPRNAMGKVQKNALRDDHTGLFAD